MITKPRAEIAKHLQVGVLAFAVLAWVVWLSFRQGLTWDESWLMVRAQDLVGGMPPDPFKPFAGFVLAPLVKLGGGWYSARAFFLGIQGLIAVGLFRLMPSAWSTRHRLLALALLWLEPTFRERVLELRTDGLVLLLMVLATLAWTQWSHRPGARALGAAGCWGLGLALSFKTALFWAAWLLAMLWADRGGRKLRTWVSLAASCALAAALVALGMVIFGWSYGIQHIGKAVANGTPGIALALKENHGWVSATWIRYFPQIVLLGLPFWGLAFLGLGLRLAGMRREPGAWGAWETAGWLALIASLFYFGAFPYHFVCIFPAVLPSVMGGLDWLKERLPSLRAKIGPAALVSAGLFSGLAAWPILAGAGIGDQLAILRYADSFLTPGRSFVDGVGMLDPAPHAAPFATGALQQSGGAEGLWRRWEAEHAAVFLGNGRTEMLLTRSNAAWMRANTTLVHPQIAVVGVSALSASGTVETVWKAPWADEFLFLGTPEWTWTLQGLPIQSGSRIHLPAGPVALAGKGPGTGMVSLFLAPKPGPPGTSPPIAKPFFLPFQRDFLDLR